MFRATPAIFVKSFKSLSQFANFTSNGLREIRQKNTSAVIEYANDVTRQDNHQDTATPNVNQKISYYDLFNCYSGYQVFLINSFYLALLVM